MTTLAYKSHLRIPPQNIDSEKALLGSIMLRPDSINEVIDTISELQFYAEKHRIIFRTMFELYGKNIPIDLLSMSSRLRETNQLDPIGGGGDPPQGGGFFSPRPPIKKNTH